MSEFLDAVVSTWNPESAVEYSHSFAPLGCETCTGVPVTFVTMPDGTRQLLTLKNVVDAMVTFGAFMCKSNIVTDNGDGTFMHTLSFE